MSGVEVEHSTVPTLPLAQPISLLLLATLRILSPAFQEDEKIVLSNILDKDEMKNTEKFGL